MKAKYRIIFQGDKFSNKVTHDQEAPVLEIYDRRWDLACVMKAPAVEGITQAELIAIKQFVSKRRIKY